MMCLHFHRFMLCLAVFMLITGAAAFAGPNLIQNGNLEGDNLAEFNFRPLRDATDKTIEDSKGGLYVDDDQANRSFRIDILRHITDKDGKKTVNACVAVGGTKGYDFQDGRAACDVEPNTKYHFSVRLKGTVHHAYFTPVLYRGNAMGYDNLDNTGKIAGLKNPVGIGPDWQEYRGSFVTHTDSTHAALRIGVYTHERYGLTEEPGTYLLIDDIKIEKADDTPNNAPKTPTKPDASSGGAIDPTQEQLPGVIRPATRMPVMYAASFSDAAPVIDGMLDDAVWNQSPQAADFRQLRQDIPAQMPTRFRVIAGPQSLFIAITCEEPAMSSIRANITADGEEVWRDDCIELFFVDPAVAQAPLRHIAINTKAARYISVGERIFERNDPEFKTWTAAVKTLSVGWNVEIELPYTLLGLAGPPKDGQSLQFNVCRARHARANEYSSWSFVAGSFHNQARFGVLLMGDPRVALRKRLTETQALDAEVGKTLSKPPVVIQNALAKIHDDLNHLAVTVDQAAEPAQWQSGFVSVEQINQQLRLLRWTDRKFHVFPVSTTSDFSLPFLPDPPEDSASSAIAVRGAVNEFVPLPIAVINSSMRTEAYRVVLFSELNDGIEVEGLKTETGDHFSNERMTLREGVRVKDSDDEDAAQRYDPLVEMNGGHVLTVPAGQGGLVWITLDCHDVKPGRYTGTLRVIPLGLAAKFTNDPGWKYNGHMRDIAFTLTVLPIALTKDPVMPVWLMNDARNERFFLDMVAHGDTMFQLSPWSFPAKYDENGQLAEPVDHAKIGEVIAAHQRWAGRHTSQPVDYVVGFSAYQVFSKQFTRNKFAPDSPEWQRAFGAWLQAMDDQFKQRGVGNDHYWVEMWDEPHRSDQQEVLTTLRFAKQAAPRMRLLMTLGASMQSPEEIRAMAQYADAFCVWGSYFIAREYRELFAELRRQGKKVWFYFCDTRQNVDLYQYYRLHAWKAAAWELDGLGLFRYMTGPGGHYGVASWKTSLDGALVYNTSGRPTPSIRYEVFRQGMDDMKYLACLRQAMTSDRDRNVNADLCNEMENFLKTTPVKVAFQSAHRSDEADAARRKVVELLMRR